MGVVQLGVVQLGIVQTGVDRVECGLLISEQVQSNYLSFKISVRSHLDCGEYEYVSLVHK